ncbi:MAG: DUF4175 family protein, partial [Pseudomonadota bacterium]
MTDDRRYSTTTAKVIADAAVAREVRRTRRALWIEQAITAFWPAWAVVALFAGVVLLGLPAALGATAHYAVLGIFCLAFLGALGVGFWRLRKPTEAEALARLDEGERGRPAQTYADALAAGSGDKGTEALWAAHQRKLAERAAQLKAKQADLRASAHDPFALRHAALLVLAAGGLGYLAVDGVRIADQLAPGELAAEPAPVVTVEAWASPPLYTGERAVYLSRIDPEDGVIELPAGTDISIRVFDSEVAPTLAQSVGGENPAGGAPIFTDQGAGVYDAEFKLTTDGEITIT